MKKILGLSVAALLVIAMVGGGTWAFFQDTENVAGNAIAAGTLDLTIDENVIEEISVTNAYPGQTDNPYYVLENIGTIGGTLSLTISNVINTESTGTTEFENDNDNNITLDSGTASVEGTTTTLTDGTKDWSLVDFTNKTVIINGEFEATISGNTATVLTFGTAYP